MRGLTVMARGTELRRQPGQKPRPKPEIKGEKLAKGEDLENMLPDIDSRQSGKSASFAALMACSPKRLATRLG
jgi:hypothetical protein